jgi:predicted alpha/beta-fold hydrolase
MRSCGGTEHLSSTNYHAGQTSDALAVLRQIRTESDAPLSLVGYSLGGNVSLKLAGELGNDAIGFLDGVCSVSTPIDLDACASELERPDNFIYENRFVAALKDRIRRRHQRYPDRYSLGGIDQVRTIRQFDDLFTAKLFQFGTAENYFATQSSNQFLESIRVPTLMIQSKDDPMIPFRVYDHPGIRANPRIRFIPTDHGGHVGFIARHQPRFWVDSVITDWARGLL